MIIEGKAVVIDQDNVDTDVLYPGTYLSIDDPEQMKPYLFEGLDPSLRDQLDGPTILVVGENFGAGSSREHVPHAMKASQIVCVVGKSFARIFHRNCLNLGLPIITHADVAAAAKPGMQIRIDTDSGDIEMDGERFETESLPPFMADMISSGAWSLGPARSLPEGERVSARNSTVLCEVQNNIALITLDRQEAANSIDLNLARELMYTVLRCGDDPAVRAVVITGRGSTFCVGGDLRSFAAQGERLPLHLKEVTIYLHAAVSHLTRMDPPVIAAVNGTAAGAGMSLACACDLVLASESARFTMAYTKVGLTPDGSSTYFLPRLVGLRRALELTLTNRVLSAEEALDWGIVSRVVPRVELIAEAKALATDLASGATAALGASKRLLYEGWTETLETQLEYEGQTISDISRTADGKEGVAAFLEKRAPKFEGE